MRIFLRVISIFRTCGAKKTRVAARKISKDILKISRLRRAFPKGYFKFSKGYFKFSRRRRENSKGYSKKSRLRREIFQMIFQNFRTSGAHFPKGYPPKLRRRRENSKSYFNFSRLRRENFQGIFKIFAPKTRKNP